MKPHLCRTCGDTNPEKFYISNKSLCKECKRNLYRNLPKEGKVRHKEKVDKWRKDNKIRFRFISAKYRAKRKGWEFNITEEYIAELLRFQNHKCWYSKRYLHDSFSIDRIDSSKGYIFGNVVLCDINVNFMKNDLSHYQFLMLIRDIYHASMKQKGSDFHLTVNAPDEDEVLRRLRD
jgi:hypothetical protein